MRKTLSSLSLAAALALALSLPAMAQGTSSSGMSMSGMKGATHATHKKSMHKTEAASGESTKPMMGSKKHHWSCYDYAWESQDQKNCLAKHEKSAGVSKPKAKSKKHKAT